MPASMRNAMACGPGRRTRAERGWASSTESRSDCERPCVEDAGVALRLFEDGTCDVRPATYDGAATQAEREYVPFMGAPGEPGEPGEA